MGLPPLPRLRTGGTDPGVSRGPHPSFARDYYCYGAVSASLTSQLADKAEGEGFKGDAGVCAPGPASSCWDVLGHPSQGWYLPRPLCKGHSSLWVSLRLAQQCPAPQGRDRSRCRCLGHATPV